MQIAALFHACRSPWAYPVGPAHLRIVLKAARGDLAGVTCLFQDRFSWPMDRDDTLPMELLGNDGVHDYWGVTVPAPRRRVRYFLCAHGVDGAYVWLTEHGPVAKRPTSGAFQYAYIHKGDAFEQPEWLRSAVFYQIFPDRFCNGDPTNDPPGTGEWGETPTPHYMAGGDLAGIRSKMNYLKELGVGCIYTTPIFHSPTNHKYDTIDYYKVDPTFGTNGEFKALVSEAHQHGIRFLLDAVFNHSGKEWFAFADVIKQGEDSPYVDWFYDLRSFPVDPSVCNYETFAVTIPTMPKLNTANPDCAAYLLDVAEHWIREAGIDGWRLDVADEVDHRFWRAFRERVKRTKPDAFILGETWHDSADWLQGTEWDSVMNYPWRDATLRFLKGELDAVQYDQQLTRLRFSYPLEMVRGLVNLLGTHDTARVMHELGSREKAAQAAVLLLTSEGVPMVYYGDEVGLTGPNDPGCRGCFPWDEPEQQDGELRSLYRRLIQIRNAFPWLNDGAWESFVADPVTGVLGFRRLPTPVVAPERPLDEEGIYVVINNCGRNAVVSLPTDLDLVDLLEGEMLTGSLRGSQLHLPERGIAILAPVALAGLVGGAK